MPTIDFYICSERQIRACQNWVEAADAFPCTGINVPDRSALSSLAGLLTGEDTYPVLPLDEITEPIFRLNSNVTDAIDSIPPEDLMDVGAKWADLAPWNEIDVNPIDLVGFVIHLKSVWDDSDEPQKAIFLWFDAEAA